ncbi:IS5 family transposase [Acaryochloris sp. 'Moss Beach']|uniref:IS5 family transposase n=1 Tax=Acaryochloris sp. 'Moss Beach' TaxID=2740837 RepID=UPI001F3C55AA|nr:IS5 family transposase [Acaryochloris sp. 'Moss Beach']UJB68738.1 IS5 family transposase [Acaryochloris sp. 'Moss Beach']
MKQQYRVRNWSEYNLALRQRGSLTFWVSEASTEHWLNTKPSEQLGAPRTYSDVAIMSVVTIKNLFQLAGRQATGLLASLFELMRLELPVPDHSTVFRRMGKLEVTLPILNREQARHVVIDSTGVKVYGEGEWKVRQHGISKRRTWRKLHLAVDETTGEILAAVVSTNDWGDSEILPDLLEQIGGEIEQVSSDGAYDTSGCYDTITGRGAQPVIPPRKNAVIWQHGNCKAPPHPRDEALRAIHKQGRKKWKQESHYHRRSLSETTMFRHKTAFGGKVQSRKFENQATELLCQCAMLNRMIQLGKPVSVPVAA